MQACCHLVSALAGANACYRGSILRNTTSLTVLAVHCIISLHIQIFLLIVLLDSLFIGDAMLCHMLISAGSDVAAVSGEGSSILHYLAISQNPEAAQVVSTIIGKAKEFPELDINLPDWDGHTPLMK